MTSGRKHEEKGIVYLTGAGPGDPSLLTVRARELIASSRHIVYDALVGSAIMELFPAEAKVYNAGKRSGRHTMSQDQINNLLVELADSGADVLRLKGGDPFIFGRGAEEAEFLLAHGVRVEVVPGVSSATAGPELAGIPLTKRGVSDRVLIISARGPGGLDINWNGICEERQTTVFMMGLSMAPEISAHLIERGAPRNTPVALIFGASLPEQRTVITDLERLGREGHADSGSGPALIVVGPAVSGRIKRGDEKDESRSA